MIIIIILIVLNRNNSHIILSFAFLSYTQMNDLRLINTHIRTNVIGSHRFNALDI